MFFADENNRTILNEFLKKKFSRDVADKTMKMRLEASEQIIELMHNHPARWDEMCKFNIAHIGKGFINTIRDINNISTGVLNINTGIVESSGNRKDVNAIYCYIYRFLCEFDFTNNGEFEELSMIKNTIENDSADMSISARDQIKYAGTVMLGQIFKYMIHSEDVELFRHIGKTLEDAKKHKEQWDRELVSQNSLLEAQKAEVEKLRDNLREYEQGFNFVGLHKGFSNLSKQKNKEAFWLFCSLIGMGIVIISSLFMNAFYFTTKDWIMLIPFISMEVILIYFFRIILINHRSVKAQIIQIELRKTLCEFIQNYAEYSQKIKATDKVALEKFENLIFSGILSNPENIPSTFDGMEQISKLLKESRGKQ